jgi:hypothetical protein
MLKRGDLVSQNFRFVDINGTHELDQSESSLAARTYINNSIAQGKFIDYSKLIHSPRGKNVETITSLAGQ